MNVFRKKSKKQKSDRMKQIYTPRQGTKDSENECEVEEKADWEKYWTKDEFRNRYIPTSIIGKGSYGVVFDGQSLIDNEFGVEKNMKVAIKKVRRVYQTDTDAKRLLRELRILRTIGTHECVVTLYDIIPPLNPKGFKEITLIFEHADADLAKIFRTNQYFTPLHVSYMLYQVMLGLQFMHSANIVHRDLKPANILINSDCTIKLCDFGLARGFSEEIENQDEAEEKEKAKENRKSLKKASVKRGLTRHVVTRWYRAPEVILLQQTRKNLTGVDMWSTGCIMAELMQMEKESCPDIHDRGPLFPGDSCFPLSPKSRQKADKKEYYSSRFDQLKVIFSVIGTPSKDEIEKITDPKAKDYLYELPYQEPQDLTKLFPGASKAALDLLVKLLQFDVDKRITVDKCLEHPYFKDVRDPMLEKLHPQVKFEFEDIVLEREFLRAFILEEVLHYNEEFREPITKSGALDPLKK